MINKRLLERLESVGHKLCPPKPKPIVFCGWDPSDPRRDEYEAYLKACRVGEPDPAFTKLDCAEPWEMYSFDHTKVPEAIQDDE